MSYPLHERIGMWLERFPFLHRFLFVFDGYAPGGLPRFRNRISGHLTVWGNQR